MDMQAGVFLCLHCMLTYCETCLLANLFKELLSLSQLQIPNGMAIITALFYLKAKKTSELTIINLKKTATQLGICTCTASRVTYTKEQLCTLIWKELFSQGKLKRIDTAKVVTKDNLMLG